MIPLITVGPKSPRSLVRLLLLIRGNPPPSLLLMRTKTLLVRIFIIIIIILLRSPLLPRNLQSTSPSLQTPIKPRLPLPGQLIQLHLPALLITTTLFPFLTLQLFSSLIV